jgi:membrane-bound metal-dependent hydrolase YbcI (DUF457 family)
MNTQTHVIMGAALLGRDIPKRAWFGALGGILPDIPMLAIVFTLMAWDTPPDVIFGRLYWQNWWQVTNAIGHNFWLWGGLLALSFFMRERLSASLRAIEGWTLVAVFSASALFHTTIDFVCHREDAHMSFWPVTRWKFISPVSYWDSRHYGDWFGAFEAILGLCLAIILFRRFQNIFVRAGLVVAMLLYVALPTYFIFNLG